MGGQSRSAFQATLLGKLSAFAVASWLDFSAGTPMLRREPPPILPRFHATRPTGGWTPALRAFHSCS